MNIAVLTINDFEFHPNARLRQAAETRGHNLVLINPYDITASIKNSSFQYFIDGTHLYPDIVIPRQGSPMGDYGLVLLRHFNNMNIPLVNGLKGVVTARNQYITLQKLALSGIKVPDTVFITKRKNFIKAVEQLNGFPVIVKQVDGMGGDGVIKVNNENQEESFLLKHLKDKKGVLVQEYINPEDRMDIRVLVAGEKIAGAMRLKPLSSDFRANIHMKGKPEKFSLSSQIANLAVKSAKACNLEIAGIDIIIKSNGSAVVIEVNYSPGFKGLEAATGLDIAGQIIDYAASVINHSGKNL